MMMCSCIFPKRAGPPSPLVLDGIYAEFSSALPSEWTLPATEVDIVTAVPLTADSALENASDVKGNIALILRGGATFVEQTKRASEAGAVGVIIVNTSDELMVIWDNDYASNIPVLMIKSGDVAKLREQGSALIRSYATSVVVALWQLDRDQAAVPGGSGSWVHCPVQCDLRVRLSLDDAAIALVAQVDDLRTSGSDGSHDDDDDGGDDEDDDDDNDEEPITAAPATPEFLHEGALDGLKNYLISLYFCR